MFIFIKICKPHNIGLSNTPTVISDIYYEELGLKRPTGYAAEIGYQTQHISATAEMHLY